MVILMNARNYSTICRLLFPQPEHPESAALNGRTLLTNAVAITDEGNLHSGLNGGRTVFRSPTTPRLEYLSIFDTGVFVKITYVGTLHIQFWGYPPEQSGRLMEEHRCTASRLDTHYLPVTFDTCSSGYFDIHINFQNEGAVFSLSLVREYPQISCNDLYDLSRCVFPKKHLCTEEQLYFRLPDDAGYYSYEEECITLFPHKYVEFSTYFNAFSCGKWAAYTTVHDLSACLEFQGTCLVEVWHALSEEVHHKVYADIHTHDTRGEIHIPLGTLSTFETGILYLKIYSFGHSRIYGGYYATGTPKTSEVHLGIVITTYKREESVIKAMRNLREGLSERLSNEDMAIFIIDNGRTLQSDMVEGALLIPSRNLGGSGGFMRGLIRIQDENKFTHCLFMDDDAFCETESIFRAYNICSYANDKKMAVAGAMLLENQMNLQYENTAFFTYICQAINHYFDMNLQKYILKNELEVKVNNKYAGWWFFMFPLNNITYYSFPFFVKGDDILFSLKNKFKIMTLNGVCTWQDDFINKDTPFSLYLTVRALLIINFVFYKYSIKNILFIIYIFLEFIVRQCMTYHYETAESNILAFDHFLKGPNFWRKNIEAGNIRKYILSGIKKEKLNICNYDIIQKDFIHAEPWRNNGILQIVSIVLTLNGHLLPNFMIDKSKNYFLYKNEWRWISPFYKKNFVTIFNKQNSTCYTLERSPLKFICLFIKSLWISIKFIFMSKKLYKKYINEIGSLTTKNFWESQFKL